MEKETLIKKNNSDPLNVVSGNMQGQKSIYICLISLDVGGTEKRIAEIWSFLQKQGWKNIHLVISRPLYNVLSKISYLENLDEKNPNLIILECYLLISFF